MWAVMAVPAHLGSKAVGAPEAADTAQFCVVAPIWFKPAAGAGEGLAEPTIVRPTAAQGAQAAEAAPMPAAMDMLLAAREAPEPPQEEAQPART